MSSRPYIVNQTGNTQPPGQQLGDEWYDPVNNRLFKQVATSGNAVTAAEVIIAQSGNVAVVGNISASGNLSITGNVTGGFILGNGSLLSGISSSNSPTTFTTDGFLKSPFRTITPEPITNPGTGLVSSNPFGGISAFGGPSLIFAHPSGRFMMTTYNAQGVIASWLIQPDGSLTFAAQGNTGGTTDRSGAVDPLGAFAYATGAVGTIQIFSFNNSTGAFTFVAGPFAAGAQIERILPDPSGRFIYTINDGDDTVSQFSLNRSGPSLTQIAPRIPGAVASLGGAIDPSGKFLYSVGLGTTHTFYLINQTTGALTLGGSFTSTQSGRQIAIEPSGRFAYLVTALGVQQYSINQTTGALTSLGSTTGTSAISSDITCDPTGRYVYTTVSGSGNTLLDSFSINDATGTLTFLGSTTTVNTPAGCCVDPGGRYVFVTCSAINLIRPYIINNFSTGAGTLIGNIQINSGALNVGNTTAYGNTGEIRATNNITAFFSSDARLKANVTPIANALSIVEAVGGKTFDWTDEYIASHGGEDAYFVQKSDFGIIAQDIQRVFPQAVRVRPDGTLAVDYEKLVAVAFQAIVELKAEIQSLKQGR